MQEITREMSISHAEFRRVLALAFRQEFQPVGSGSVEFENSDGSIRLILGQETSRRMGSITIAVTRLTLRFSGMGPDRMQDFLVRFDRSFQRGGG